MLFKGRPTIEYVSLREKGFRENVIDRILCDGRKLPKMTPKDREKFMELARVHFDSQTIMANREIAKRLGIESATLIPKEALVEKLVDFVWGMQYYQHHRPQLEGPDQKSLPIIDEIKEIEYAVKGEFVWGEVVTGYVELCSDGTAILRTALTTKHSTDVYVLRRLVSENKLADGDEVECRAHYNKQIKCLVAHSIDKINGYRPDAEGRFNQVNQTDPSQRVILPPDEWGFSNSLNLFAPLRLGQSVLVSYTGAMKKGYGFISLAKAVIQSGVFDEVIPTMLGENEKTIEQARAELGEEKIIYSNAGNREQDSWMINQILAYSKTASKYGKKIALLILDLDTASADEINRALEIASSGVSYENGGSLTVISFADIENESFKYAKRNADSRLDLSFIPFNNTYRINAQNCYSFSSDEQSAKEKLVLEKLYDSTYALERAFEIIKTPIQYDALLDALSANPVI